METEYYFYTVHIVYVMYTYNIRSLHKTYHLGLLAPKDGYDRHITNLKKHNRKLCIIFQAIYPLNLVPRALLKVVSRVRTTDSTTHDIARELEPIFHWKVGLRWLPNANEINTENMKCTWPTRKFCIWNPTQPIFH